MSFLLTLFYCAVLGVSWFDVFSFINRDTPLFYVLLFAPSILIYYAFASEYVRAIEQRRRNFREMNVLETDENKPIIYMTYVKIPKIQKWIDKINSEIDKYPDIMLQIGLKMLDADKNDITLDVINRNYDKDLINLFLKLKKLGNKVF